MNQPETLEIRVNNLIQLLANEIKEDRKFIAARPPGPAPSSLDPIIFSDELNFLNKHWSDWNQESDFKSHRPIIGSIVGRLKRKVQRYFFHVLFKEYFDREREFIMKLVQFNNLSAKYIDSRYESLFWEIVKKVDREIEQVNLRNDAIFSEIVKDRILNSSDKK